MGLDTTHDCWHGSYSAFMRWRQALNHFVMRDRVEAGDVVARQIADKGMTHEAVIAAWDAGVYADQSVPINVLMQHSDCEGEIAAEICGPLADALQAIADKWMDPRGLYDAERPATDRFIAGLRLAASKGEAVEFH